MRRAPATSLTRTALAASLALATLLACGAAHAQTPLPDPYDYDEATPAPKRAAPLRWQKGSCRWGEPTPAAPGPGGAPQ